MISMRHQRLVLCAVVMLAAQPGASAEDVNADLEDVALDAAGEAGSKESDAAPAELTPEQQQTLQHYEKLAKELESSGGVYDTRLSEVLSGLGNTYQASGRHAEAIDLFERALHINRVNDGLYSLSQVAMLEKLIESNTALKDWQALDRNYHNLYWINQRHYGENSPDLLPVIERLGRWHLLAYEKAPGAESFSHLVNAELLYNRAVDIIEMEGGAHDIRLINALYGIALTNYQIAARVSSSEDFDDIRAGYRDANRTRRMLQEQRAREDLVMQSYARGKEAMNQVIEIHANNPILPLDTQAMAMTHLGDWYLLFNKRDSAATTYEQAYRLMENDGMSKADIDRLFGQPRTLPAIRLPLQLEPEVVPENPAYVLASFDVSPSGKAQNIQIIESMPEDNVSYLRKAKRSIAATRFRPRYENGKPVLTTGVSLRYVFTD